MSEVRASVPRDASLMVTFGYFGIKSSVLSLIVDLLVICFAVIYVALIYWTVTDARRRIGDPLLVGCAFLVSLVPFVGAIVYMIVRPPDFLEDARERELEIRTAEARLARLRAELCPHCDFPIERDFLRCPSCQRQLKERCGSCSRPLDPGWSLCPYCEAPAPGGEPERSRRRRARVERESQAELGPRDGELEPSAPRGRRARREAPPLALPRRPARTRAARLDRRGAGRGARSARRRSAAAA
ncbi:MAG: zinc ribbon domain-containing protein [Solirubrobacteraceae bacterium]